MELVAIFIIPVLASGLSMFTTGRRLAAPITLTATAIILALAVAVAMDASRAGHVSAPGEWLTCDGLGGLVLVLVALVEFTAALFSWGYIAERIRHGGAGNLQ